MASAVSHSLRKASRHPKANVPTGPSNRGGGHWRRVARLIRFAPHAVVANAPLAPSPPDSAFMDTAWKGSMTTGRKDT
jgi:hypothetical protein